MLINLYKSKTPLAVFTLPILVAILCTSIFFNPQDLELNFFTWQTGFLSPIHEVPWINFLCSIIIISINAHQLNHVFNKNRFYSKESYLPGFLYLLWLMTFEALNFSSMLLAHLLFIGALASLLKLRRQEPAKAILFAASFQIGLGIIFSPLMMPIVLLPWIALIIIKPFNLREWLIPLFAAALPTCYHYTFYFLATGAVDIEMVDITIRNPEIVWNISESLTYGLAGFAMLVGVFKFLKVMNGQIVNFKKMSQIVLVMLAFSFLSYVAAWYFYGQHYISFVLPLSFIMSVQVLNATRVQLAEGLILVWFIIGGLNLFV